MNKKLIAMAVAAGLAAPMAANAGVTVYGHLQVEIASVDNKGYGENNTGGARNGMGELVDIATDGSKSGIKMADNKRGRLGFKISEDLGGNLKGIAKFEWQVDTPNGNIADGAREGWVGLKGGWGEFKAGRIKTPYKYTGGVKYDPFVTTYMEARKSGGMLGGAYGQNSFWSNSISYKNKWGGFSLWIDYGLDEGNGTDAGSTSGTPGTTTYKEAIGKYDSTMGDISASVKYGTKNWEIFAAYNGFTTWSGDVGDTAGESKESHSVTKFGGQIKFAGAHTISGQYEMVNPDGDNNDATIYFLGYQFKMGKNIIAAQYGNTDADVNTEDVTYYALGLIHKFSKKTRTFIGYRNSDGDGDDDLSVISAGLRVDF